ncbi:MAG TPA: GAF domain-containing protein [Anaerolineales bacterium]|nr:GAF domain-containing protein [Anaerolineales bacterium]
MTDNSPNNRYDSGDTLLTLINRVRDLLRPPVFSGDEDKTRQAAVTYNLLTMALIISALYSLTVFFTSNRPVLIAGALLVVQVILVFSMRAIRRGRTSQVGLLVTIFFWVFIAVLSVLYGSVVNPLLPTFVVVIFAAGLMVSNQVATIFTIVTVFYNILYLVAEMTIELPSVLVTTPANFTLRITFNAIVAAVFIIIANRATAQAFKELSNIRKELVDSNEELSQMQQYLQETVTERTTQLEKRNKYLEAAQQVARESLSTLDLQEMLDTIASLISELFGFYHVGIFLLDDRKEWAVLKAVSSPGGQIMLRRNHRLEVGKQGIVGFVTSIGQARISQDIELDRIHSVTAELPDTRSEMALPLKVRNNIIGALDIQDSTPNAFEEDDLSILQTVADQIALAVENIRLYQQTQETIEEIQRVYGEYSQQAWSETYQKNLLHSYRYAGGSVEAISDNEQINLIGNKVSVPISIRGQYIGAIEIAKGENPEDWSDDELKLLHTLSEQLGVALDSARLYNETQLRASTEHVISQISSELWETLEINSILKTAAEKLRTALAVPELTVRLTKPASEPQTESQNGSSNLPETVEDTEEEIEN